MSQSYDPSKTATLPEWARAAIKSSAEVAEAQKRAADLKESMGESTPIDDAERD